MYICVRVCVETSLSVRLNIQHYVQANTNVAYILHLCDPDSYTHRHS